MIFKDALLIFPAPYEQRWVHFPFRVIPEISVKIRLLQGSGEIEDEIIKSTHNGRKLANMIYLLPHLSL